MDQVAIINQFLQDNNVHAVCSDWSKRGNVSKFDLKLNNDCRISKLQSLSQELMILLRTNSVPNIFLVPDKGVLRVEIISGDIETPYLLNTINNELYSRDKLIINLGSSVKSDPIIVDISKNPHLLIAGTTGSGKSSLLHTIITNLVIGKISDTYIVDTKGTEFDMYQDFTNRAWLFSSYEEYVNLLYHLYDVMEHRFNVMRANGISSYQECGFDPIVLIIDEFADLIMQSSSDECSNLLCKLTQKCRAAGIYCILATQRPSANIITGSIKANFPARIACRVGSKTDSRIILDSNGAEKINTIGRAIINNYKYSLETFQIAYAPLEDIYNFLLKSYEKMETLS